jgi:hypothetical protein
MHRTHFDDPILQGSLNPIDKIELYSMTQLNALKPQTSNLLQHRIPIMVAVRAPTGRERDVL